MIEDAHESGFITDGDYNEYYNNAFERGMSNVDTFVDFAELAAKAYNGQFGMKDNSKQKFEEMCGMTDINVDILNYSYKRDKKDKEKTIQNYANINIKVKTKDETVYSGKLNFQTADTTDDCKKADKSDEVISIGNELYHKFEDGYYFKIPDNVFGPYTKEQKEGLLAMLLSNAVKK